MNTLINKFFAVRQPKQQAWDFVMKKKYSCNWTADE